MRNHPPFLRTQATDISRGSDTLSAMRRGPFLALFAVSGAAALIYEVVWTRLLTLQMGHGVAAASTVLAAFMGGLAIGSAIAGRIGGRLSPRRALTIYASLELTIAVLALLLPFGLVALRPLLSSAYAEGSGGVTFAILRLATSVLLLAAPAAAMGATFPIASRWMVRVASHAARDAGGLYAANTLGAAIGAVLAGFVLIPALGLSGSTWVAVLLNVIAAAGAFAIARTAIVDALQTQPADTLRAKSGAGKGGTKVPPLRSDGLPGQAHPWIAALALGASGFASLTLQVVWTRLLVLILGPTTYAFSIVVSIFIVGLAGGAAIGARLAARARQPAVGLAMCLLASAGLAIAAASAVDWALLTMAEVVARPGVDFDDVLLREVAMVAALLLPMTLTFGAAFPYAVSLASRSSSDQTVTEHLGRIYAVNTIGAVTGALLTGFVLVPRIGLHTTIRSLTVLVAVAAIAILVTAAARGRGRITAVVTAAVTRSIESGVRDKLTRVAILSPGTNPRSAARSPTRVTTPSSMPPEPVTGLCCLPRRTMVCITSADTRSRSPSHASSICRKLAASMFNVCTSTMISVEYILVKSLSSFSAG